MKFLFICLISCLFISEAIAQEQKETKIQNGDTAITVYAYFDNGKAVEKYGYHKAVYKYLKDEFLYSELFDAVGNPCEGTEGYHKKVNYWKYDKFYNKSGEQLLYVEESYFYELSDVNTIVYEFSKNGDLKSVGYFNKSLYNDNMKKLDKAVMKPVGMAYMEADIHKLTYKFDRVKGLVTEKAYSPYGQLVKIKTYSWKGCK